MDDIADGGDTVGVRWHVENDGEPLPFTRGASIYKSNENGLLCSGFRRARAGADQARRAGLALLSLASKIIDEPVRALPLALRASTAGSSSSPRASCSRARRRWPSTARRGSRSATCRSTSGSSGRRSSAARFPCVEIKRASLVPSSGVEIDNRHVSRCYRSRPSRSGAGTRPLISHTGSPRGHLRARVVGLCLPASLPTGAAAGPRICCRR